MSELLLVRGSMPVRSAVKTQTTYQSYRADLKRDFHGACGYCGDEDVRVDAVVFHIDHFAPKSRFPDLAVSYGNLVYACRYCNLSKSDHWIGNDAGVHNDGNRGFVDPCAEDYEQHLERLASGRIVGKTELGRYILGRLKLNLLRHELLWQARRARKLRDEVNRLLGELEALGQGDSSGHHELLKRYRSLNEAIEDYELRAYG
ncbi:HNH endonuclease [Nisaea sp.]|uniref:HNH endonuclease n=1 Tax=Nisaea sp. TaxID=2024842 RepID=UPI003299C0F0